MYRIGIMAAVHRSRQPSELMNTCKPRCSWAGWPDRRRISDRRWYRHDVCLRCTCVRRLIAISPIAGHAFRPAYVILEETAVNLNLYDVRAGHRVPHPGWLAAKFVWPAMIGRPDTRQKIADGLAAADRGKPWLGRKARTSRTGYARDEGQKRIADAAAHR
jgi:hypothetical protein